MSPVQIAHLIDTDNPSQLEEDLRTIKAKHRNEGPLSSSKQTFSNTADSTALEGKDNYLYLDNMGTSFRSKYKMYCN